jgi:hypothetical protein
MSFKFTPESLEYPKEYSTQIAKSIRFATRIYTPNRDNEKNAQGEIESPPVPV